MSLNIEHIPIVSVQLEFQNVLKKTADVATKNPLAPRLLSIRKLTDDCSRSREVERLSQTLPVCMKWEKNYTYNIRFIQTLLYSCM